MFDKVDCYGYIASKLFNIPYEGMGDTAEGRECRDVAKYYILDLRTSGKTSNSFADKINQLFPGLDKWILENRNDREGMIDNLSKVIQSMYVG